MFEPIAIIGQSCVLPGALTVKSFWEAIHTGKDLLSTPPPNYWRVDPDSVISQGRGDLQENERARSNRGGYVTGFDAIFDPTGFAIPATQINQLDKLFQWLLHTARSALNATGKVGDIPSQTGVIIGNLSYPSHALTQFAESVWLNTIAPPLTTENAAAIAGVQRPAPENRFMSGYPAHLVAKALGLTGESFCLDAACASSLYAIKLACDRLHDRRANLMLVGAVNHADDLFLHVGFSALQALSKSGRSLPFHRDADGLLPGEGAACIALKRLNDAEQNNDQILGVIRAVGLSNDGRSGSFLAPDKNGQIRAMQAAYQQCNLQPADISLIECHATGTPVGDAEEISSMSTVFKDANALPIGSLKSNMGHLITASGLAGIMKVMAAMEAGIRPPTLNTEAPIAAIAATPFRLLHTAEAWDCKGPRRAAINNFGFGGNNAHLIVEQWQAKSHPPAKSAKLTKPATEAIAIVGMSVTAGDGTALDDFINDLYGTTDHQRSPRASHVKLPIRNLRFPPTDLQKSLPQQTLMMQVAIDAVADAGGADHLNVNTGVFVGMQCDAEIARFGVRWRMTQWREKWSTALLTTLDDDWTAAARDGAGPILQAAGVVGAMPNIPANRLNSLFDWRGFGFTVSSEELSGVSALNIAVRALRNRELDAALVGAVDLSCEPVHQAAASAVLPAHLHTGGDAGVALILKRLTDAKADGDKIYAILPETSDAPLPPSATRPLLDLNSAVANHFPQKLGHAHCASGLLHIAAAALTCAHKATPQLVTSKKEKAQPTHSATPWLPAANGREIDINIGSFSGQTEQVRLLDDATTNLAITAQANCPTLHVYSGTDRQALITALQQQQESNLGPMRIVLVRNPHIALSQRIDEAIALLTSNAPTNSQSALADGIYFAEQPTGGELAFVFTGAAAAYAGMGKSLLVAMPKLADNLVKRFPSLATAAAWIYSPETATATTIPPFDHLRGCAFLCQIHAEFSQRVLGLQPQAALGVSSGETNALYALGAWRDLDAIFTDISASAMYDRFLAGTFDTARSVLQIPKEEPIYWSNWQILAPVTDVEEILKTQTRVWLTIINAADDCIIGGLDADCRHVIAQIGKHRAMSLGHDLIVHCEAMQPFATTWRQIHQRKTYRTPKTRFYTNATGTHYKATAKATTNALFTQAMQTIDFRKTVENAWQDGVRIFLEHGPRNTLSSAITKILGKREHVTIAFDKGNCPSLQQAFHATAQLIVAGVDVDLKTLQQYSEKNMPTQPHTLANSANKSLELPAHYPAVKFPAMTATTTQSDADYETMVAAPWLPPVHAEKPVVNGPVPTPDLAIALAPASVSAPVLVPITATPTTTAPTTTAPTKPASTPAPTDVRNTNNTTVSASLSQPATTPAPIPVQLANVLADNTGACHPLASFVTQMAAVHQQFTQQQSLLHQRFLALQAESWNRFTNGMTAPEMAQAWVPQLVQNQPIVTPTPLNLEPTSLPLAAKPTVFNQPASPPSPVIKPSVAPPRTKATQPAPQPADSTAGDSSACESVPIPEGRTFTRQQLEILASGSIASVFGPLFTKQDHYHLQVRMPEPPLLLADRVTGLVGEPGSMTRGTIWTETDIKEDAWYLHQGAVPPGILIEAGQADLLLISWLGADFHNKGERAYRLLGCELTYHVGGMPAPGDTLCYDIHVDGHAKHGDVRLFFFHYDCRVNGKLRFSVREGQAGFFNTKELAESGGVLWSAEEDTPKTPAQVDPAAVICQRSHFSPQQVLAFTQGDALQCFGPGFEACAPHTRTPGITMGRMNMIHEVTCFEAKGGPWKRGYLRAETPITPNDWFFKGHFKNDPCMPGTLMADAAIQTMAFFMTALGFTMHRDGWRFEPVDNEAYKFVCRGQVLPNSRNLVYEVFVEEIIAAPHPTIFAALLCTGDGLKVFQCRRFGLRLIPNWPLTSKLELLKDHKTKNVVGDSGDVRGDYAALLACAWGSPSSAFGEMYRRFDGPGTVPRLPGPPYHFMSRVLNVEGHPGKPVVGHTLVSEYDVPATAWYFQENGYPVMPFAVLLEVLLQPCGWFGSFMGFATRSKIDLCIRNLDGDESNQLLEVTPGCGTMRIKVTFTKLTQMGAMALVFFHVDGFCGDQSILSLNTSFGFFTQDNLKSQVGLPVDDASKAWKEKPCDYLVDLTQNPARFCEGSLRLANPMLRMIDKITGFWPEAGEASLGRIRGYQKIKPEAWYFKAHFFQDPVQPGSLGLEALLQLLQCFMLATDLDKPFAHPRFEAIALNESLIWKYRGQVIPSNNQVITELEITAIKPEKNAVLVLAKGSLWVDTIRIYTVLNMGMRIVEMDTPVATYTDAATTTQNPTAPSPAITGAAMPAHQDDIQISLKQAPWLADHCPTYTVPALPMMLIVEYLAAAAKARAPHLHVVRLENIQIHRWLVLQDDTSIQLRTEVKATAAGVMEVVLLAWRDASLEKLSRFEAAANGTIYLADEYPSPPAMLSPLLQTQTADNPYESGVLFHGPAFQVLRHLEMGDTGASACLQADASPVPQGVLNPVLLDGATHAIPHDRLQRWFADIPTDQVAYPHQIPVITLYGPTPRIGEVRTEVRAQHFDQGTRHPTFDIQMQTQGNIWLTMTLVEILFPKGPLGSAPARTRRIFLRDRRFTPNLALSELRPDETVLSRQTVHLSNWLPGTLEQVYQTQDNPIAIERQIAIKEHIARKASIHPYRVTVDDATAHCDTLPLTSFPVYVHQEGDAIVVKDNGEPKLDLLTILDFWRNRLDASAAWPVEDLFFSLIRRFVGRVIISDPDAFATIRGTNVLFLGNHQVGIESLLFSVIAGGLIHQPVVTIAKAEHRQTWLGRLIALCQNYPGRTLPKNIMFFDRQDRTSMLKLLAELKDTLFKEGLSLMIHAEGTRVAHCGQPVKLLSAVIVDFAIASNLPIVPVRFAGGLPSKSETSGKLLEFPLGYAKQDYYLGAPIAPKELSGLPLKERTERVLNAINTLGPDLAEEVPNAPNPDFASQVKAWGMQKSVSHEYATIFRTLLNDRFKGKQFQRFMDHVKRENLLPTRDPEERWLVSFSRWLGLK